jgi:nicotinamidase-related amidase
MAFAAMALAAEPLVLPARDATNPQQTLAWEANRTALIICDMWDAHWCPGATARVAEMAPRLNAFAQAARARGVLIIHCPSSVVDFYADHPGRKLAMNAPKVQPSVPLERWCRIDLAAEAPLPIDDSDGGCDTPDFTRDGNAPNPWTRQIASIEIAPQDAITDSAEAYYLMRQRGITNVLICGVHLNMCVLGRPFGIRQLVRQGMSVALVRDLTDTMYNSAQPPHVSHFEGTRRMLAHVEKYWCPTVASNALLGGAEFRFHGDTGQ